MSDERTAATFEAFSLLIGAYLDVERQRERAQAALLDHMRTQARQGSTSGREPGATP